MRSPLTGTVLRGLAYAFQRFEDRIVVKFLLFCVLLVLCWPLALIALVLYPFVWLILLPFRLVGIVVGGTFELIAALFTLPVRLLRAV
jgi:hypothetical protein